MNSNEIKTIIWSLMNNIRGIVYSRNPAFSAIRLLFLKYVIDNNIGVASIEDMQQCARAQKMFALRDVDSGADTVFTVLKYIDRTYGLDGILSHSIDEYARELFGIDTAASKKRATSDGFKKLMDMLGQFDFEETTNDHSIGRLLVDEFVEVFYQTSDRKSFTGMFTSKRSLNQLAKGLLAVTSSDTFCDYASGTGLSTLTITRGVDPQIVNVEVDSEIASLSAMLYILYGYSHINVICADSLSTKVAGVSGNKLFVDGPIAGKLEDTDTNRYKDTSLAVVDRAIHCYLESEGRAIITVPSGFLFGSSRPSRELKEELINLGMIDAIIALPPLWNGTNIGTNLLVLNKGVPRNNVLFINALDILKNGQKNNARNNGELSEEVITKIINTVSQRNTEEGFSTVISSADVKDNQYNLTPAAYVTTIVEEDTITLDEIDAELKLLYQSLQTL